ncbi:uncharacterized protein BCR38DRAFT_487721 [Pseudomassariella vexata]|uniref:Uncharacterized protein n=1 Tax=Pseudomassariella vexata TaxID=1141098 RepID=A0A1Y2DN13_9PEZI|nr:uncharacterized protein BCR38DRAFT_487721 [Pseudomassariella vexata]ORY60662.1 hypothetical protein BCR38DRAFT_487721 [Pseudomassariella vexata]
MARYLKNQGSFEHILATMPDLEVNLQPVLVNWNTELAYLDVSKVFDPFSLVANQSWSPRIQHLALHLGRSSIKHLGYQLDCGKDDRNLASKSAEETLKQFGSLMELVFVVKPFPESEDEWKQMPRDDYGFVPFDAGTGCDRGSHRPHITFQRIVEVYQDVIDGLGRPIKLRTAVEVDNLVAKDTKRI